MKLRRRLAVTVFIILMIIVTISFAYINISILQTNEIVIAAPKNQSTVTKEYIEKIDKEFKDKLDFQIDKKNIYIKTHDVIGNNSGKYFTLISKNNNTYYKGRINTKTNEVIELDYYNKRKNVERNDEINKKHGIKDAKKISLDFIKNNNLVDGSKVEFIEEYIKNNSKRGPQYYIFFKYNKREKLLIKIDKYNYKVNGFLLES